MSKLVRIHSRFKVGSLIDIELVVVRHGLDKTSQDILESAHDNTHDS